MTLDFRKIGQDLIAEAYSHGPPQPDTSEPVCQTCGGAWYVRGTRTQTDHHVEVGYQPCPVCQRPVEDRQRQAGVVKGWDTWQTSEATLDASVALCELVEGLRWSVTLRGPCGVGKTHMAHAAAGDWIARGGTAVVLAVPDFLSSLRKAIDEQDTSIDQRREMYQGVGLLVLDDFGAERPTQWTQEQMYQVVNHRYNARLPLIVTTNNMRLDARVMSRLGPGLVEIKANDQRKVYER